MDVTVRSLLSSMPMNLQVLEIQAALREPEVGREDLAQILQAVQALEKENLRMVGHPTKVLLVSNKIPS